MMLHNKNVILTGAAGGIGQVIAQKFAEEGAILALIDISEKDLIQIYGNISKKSSGSFYLCCDISSRAQIQVAVSEILRRMGQIDIVINNAGIQKPIGEFYQNDLDLWQRNIEVNLFGAVYLTWYVLPGMMKNKKGKIINLSGGGATSPRPNFSAYAVAKTAIVKFTEELAMELRDYHIDVNAISPGAINTRMLDEVIEAGNLAGIEYAHSLKRKEKGGSDPRLVADLICFLASDQSDGISGKLISAPWDPWQTIEYQNLLKSNNDIATLRRIDNKYFRKL